VTERNLPADDLGWLPDAPATGFLLDRGQIERVEANPAHARTILEQARMHLSSARILAATEDTAAAFVTAYDATRKSLSAMLAVQGLRARGGDGGHRVLGELMQAQLPQHRRTLREFDWMRQKRNDTPLSERPARSLRPAGRRPPIPLCSTHYDACIRRRPAELRGTRPECPLRRS